MGGQSKSAELHELHGTSPHRSSVPTQSRVAGALPRPPKFLSKEAKKKFRSLSKQLDVRRAVTAGDADLIAIYCSTWERWQQALDNLRTEGLIVEYTRLDAGGNPVPVEKPNISLKIAEVAERACLSYLSRLGLTPRDRELVRPTAPVEKMPDITESERLDEEIAVLQAQEVADKAVQAADEDLLASIDETVVDEPLTETQKLLAEADAALAEDL
jgi:P27 family predicted phage terminase small subunit